MKTTQNIDFITDDYGNLIGSINPKIGATNERGEERYIAFFNASMTSLVKPNGEEVGIGGGSGGGAGASTPATTTAAGVVELATSTEAVEGTDSTRAVTPTGLKAATDALSTAILGAIPAPTPYASLTVAGKVELATGAEALAGTDDLRVVTPLALKSVADEIKGLIPAATPIATNLVAGRVELATEEEALLGVDNQRAVTALGVKSAIEYNKTPASDNRKIVIFGSSVAAGWGSTGNNTGWAKLLADDLTPQGYTVVNRSVPSNATADLINRFYTDVAQESPHVVVIALSLANEGIIASSDKAATYTEYINNIHRLVAMVRKLGAKPIIGGTYPNNLYTAAEYAYCKQFDAEIEAAGIPLLAFMGALDDGTGKWRAGTFTDDYHPNNTGHLAMTRAIPRSLFARLPDGQDSIGRFDMRSDRAVQLGADTSINGPMLYTPDYALGSFTVLARVRRPAGAAVNKPVISLYSSAKGTNSVRVLAPTDAWVLQGSSVLVASSRLSSLSGHDLLGITYDTHSDILRFWVNGVLAGTDTASGSLGTVAYINFGGLAGAAAANAVGYQFQDIGIWRTALNADQMAEAARGEYTKGGLEILAPCWDADLWANQRFVNLAPSASALTSRTALFTSVSGYGDTQSALADTQSALAERPVTTGSPNAVSTLWSGTQAQYDAIPVKSSTTIYFVEA